MLAEAAAVLPQPATAPMQPGQADGALKTVIVPTARKYNNKDAKALENHLKQQGIRASVAVGVQNMRTGELITARPEKDPANALDSRDVCLEYVRCELSGLQITMCELDSRTADLDSRAAAAFNKTQTKIRETDRTIGAIAQDMKNLILYVQKLESEKSKMHELIENLSARVMQLEEHAKKDIPAAETARPPTP